MDSPRLVSLYGFMLAENARIEGMKAANAAAVHRGELPTYSEDHFQVAAGVLDQLAVEARNA